MPATQEQHETGSDCVIVDDHEAVRSGLEAQLDLVDGIRVEGGAATFTEALELLRTAEPSLALVDVRIPEGDGLELLRAARREGIATRFVFYSGNGSGALVRQALDAGASAFVLKGSPVATVVEALQCAKAGRRFLDPTLAADLLADDGRPELSAREREVLTRMATGAQNASIAHELGISPETVKAHISSIMAKFDAVSRTEVVATALREGIID